MPNPLTKRIGEAGQAVMRMLHCGGTPPRHPAPKTWTKGVKGDAWRGPDEKNLKVR